ncbi:hypothetical protein HDU76_003488 [Blyttiomyces sp. JEL0837]|nr:hypothetical protein HDU76_003488 [Blyttiomyces sp. JEL0837]
MEFDGLSSVKTLDLDDLTKISMDIRRSNGSSHNLNLGDSNTNFTSSTTTNIDENVPVSVMAVNAESLHDSKPWTTASTTTIPSSSSPSASKKNQLSPAINVATTSTPGSVTESISIGKKSISVLRPGMSSNLGRSSGDQMHQKTTGYRSLQEPDTTGIMDDLDSFDINQQRYQDSLKLDAGASNSQMMGYRDLDLDDDEDDNRHNHGNGKNGSMPMSAAATASFTNAGIQIGAAFSSFWDSMRAPTTPTQANGSGNSTTTITTATTTIGKGSNNTTTAGSVTNSNIISSSSLQPVSPKLLRSSTGNAPPKGYHQPGSPGGIVKVVNDGLDDGVVGYFNDGGADEDEDQFDEEEDDDEDGLHDAGNETRVSSSFAGGTASKQNRRVGYTETPGMSVTSAGGGEGASGSGGVRVVPMTDDDANVADSPGNTMVRDEDDPWILPRILANMPALNAANICANGCVVM